MPRDITEAFKAYLNGETMQCAICVKLVLTNSTVMGFTTWDSDIVFDGVTYEHQSAVSGSPIVANVGTGVDNMEVTGLIMSDSITDADIFAGKYDKSRLSIFMVNPDDLTIGNMIPLSGTLGDFKTAGNKYIVELRSLTQLMSQQIGETINPTCMVKFFGDHRCKFDTVGGMDTSGHPVRYVGTVTSVPDQTSMYMSGIVSVLNYYTYGKIQFITGANAGITREIKVHGDPSSYLSNNVISSPSSPGGVPFNSNLTVGWLSMIGTYFTFPIPSGTWSSAYLSYQGSWNLRSQIQQGTVNLYVQVPIGNQYLLDQESWSGIFQNNITLESPSLAAINTLASGGGGTMTCGLQLHNDQAQHLLDVYVQDLVLTLSGSPAGASDLLLLGDAFPYPVSPGDTAYVTAGCDLLDTTCANKWNNINNFRGFPHIPGTDLILKVGIGA